MILYIHGFNSTGKSFKYNVLKKHFPEELIVAPDLSYSPKEAINQLEKIIESSKERVLIIGTSLGGFYGRYLMHKYDCVTLMINPSFTPWETLKDHIGTVTNINSGINHEFKEEYIEELKHINTNIIRKNISGKLVNIFVALDDEVIHHRNIELEYPYYNKILFFPNSGHRFNNFEETIDIISEILYDAKNISLINT